MNDKNDNIEEKIKDVIKNKLTENLDDNTMDLINKLYEIFPNLKDESNIKSNQTNKTISDTNEIVLEEIIHDNVTYYKDKRNGVWDSTAELVGIIYKEQVYMFQ
ncbi:hypothetical protein Klosneuvirus_2_218 [Klosneuvirus KNV1]|uniref:Uncharacterized protein n=1 Tax=Klosneuvirus KNV1 TaxID=1977640 RepID=A0A1V0SJ78_9VIRU|nr:hypothetical protein Klosneuvirus_2_218 [Klosneuvirus KNV1]